MIEAIDWPSFGYGAGGMLLATYAGASARPVARWARRVWAAICARQDLVPARELKQLRVRVDEAEERAAELQKQVLLMTAAQVMNARRAQLAEEHRSSLDRKWQAYQARKKLPKGRGAASPPTFWTRR